MNDDIDWEAFESLVADEMALEQRYLEFFNDQIAPALAIGSIDRGAVYNTAKERSQEVRQAVIEARGSVRGLNFENIPLLATQRMFYVRDGVPPEAE
jgi:hypothetical protein